MKRLLTRRISGGLVCLGLIISGLAPCVAQPVPAAADSEEAPDAEPMTAESADVRLDRTRQVERLHAEGVALFKAQQFQVALERFEEAKSLIPDPVLTYNIARCNEALGNLAAAEAAYSDVGADASALPELRVRASARAEAVRSAMTAAAKLPRPVEPLQSIAKPKRGEPEEPEEPSDALAWSILGVGVVAAAAGGFGYYLGVQDHQKIEDAVSGDRGRLTRVKAKALDEDGRTFKLWGGVAAGVGLTLAVVGSVMLAGDDNEVEGEEPGDVTIGVVPTSTGAHGFIGWEF